MNECMNAIITMYQGQCQVSRVEHKKKESEKPMPGFLNAETKEKKQQKKSADHSKKQKEKKPE